MATKISGWCENCFKPLPHCTCNKVPMFTHDQIKQAITLCNKPDGFDLQQFKEILGIE